MRAVDPPFTPRLYAGTSGYSYKEWKGSFYPDSLPASQMLHFYAERFGTVEINNTFYRMPQKSLLASWSAEVPDGFTFVLKASQRITHIRRLRNAEDEVQYFFDTASELGPKLGPCLFQLPPFARKDTDALRAFLALIPKDRRVALEFRHPSWSEPDVADALRAAGAALCLADTAEEEKKPARPKKAEPKGTKAKAASAKPRKSKASKSEPEEAVGSDGRPGAPEPAVAGPWPEAPDALMPGASSAPAPTPTPAPPALIPTADWGYLRLRRCDYTDQDLRDWIARIRAQPWKEVFVFFKHEDEATGPQLAARFVELFREA